MIERWRERAAERAREDAELDAQGYRPSWCTCDYFGGVCEGHMPSQAVPASPADDGSGT